MLGSRSFSSVSKSVLSGSSLEAYYLKPGKDFSTNGGREAVDHVFHEMYILLLSY